jgi:hypothetical protein
MDLFFSTPWSGFVLGPNLSPYFRAGVIIARNSSNKSFEFIGTIIEERADRVRKHAESTSIRHQRLRLPPAGGMAKSLVSRGAVMPHSPPPSQSRLYNPTQAV